jgi:Nucleotidyl transferase AbiEii toxin, Type IV TA system
MSSIQRQDVWASPSRTSKRTSGSVGRSTLSFTVAAKTHRDCSKSALDPHVSATIRPYVSDDVPDIDLTVADVTTIQPTRTFWDKVVIVHGLRAWFEKRGELRQEGQRISRHYYDLHVVFHGDNGAQALADLTLGAECVRHAQMFFNRPDFNLGAATPGSFGLTPVGKMMDALRRDYDAMAGMIIGPVPRFEDVIASITAIEERLNGNHQ